MSKLDYHSPQLAPANSERELIVRGLALFLAILATLWGVVGALFLPGSDINLLLILAPGYVVMFGYYWRALGRPSLWVRRAIWSLSTLVQGTWFYLVITDPGVDWSACVFLLWWGGAGVASIIALFFER